MICNYSGTQNLSLKPIRIATRRSLFICNFEVKLQQLAMTPE